MVVEVASAGQPDPPFDHFEFAPRSQMQQLAWGNTELLNCLQVHHQSPWSLVVMIGHSLRRIQ
jgi:hypothetical protein